MQEALQIGFAALGFFLYLPRAFYRLIGRHSPHAKNFGHGTWMYTCTKLFE